VNHQNRLNDDQMKLIMVDLERMGEIMDRASAFQLPGLAKQAAECQLKITRELVAREIERHE